MSSDIALPPLSVQIAELSAANNASLLFTFLMGSYTTVYLGTLYLYLTRKAPQRVVVIFTITLLYLIGITQFAVQWFLTLFNFFQTSLGYETTFIALFDYPTWSHIVIDVTSFSMFVVADGLLIWRCYHVWGQSYRVTLLPLFLLLVEVGFFISSIIFILAVHSHPSGGQINIINDLQAAVFFVSFATSLTTTVLIAYRIYSSARNISDVSFSTSKARFTHIIEIIIQSAAIYSVVLLVAAISGVIPTTGVFPGTSEFSLSSYSSCLLVPAAGMAPTIMVARVSLASRANNDHVESHAPGDALSNLQFERQGLSTNQNGTRIDLRMHGENYQVYDPRYREERKDSASMIA